MHDRNVSLSTNELSVIMPVLNVLREGGKKKGIILKNVFRRTVGKREIVLITNAFHDMRANTSPVPLKGDKF